MKTKKILLGVALILLIITGCQLASDSFWPVQKAEQAELYKGTDPNEAVGIQSLGRAKATKQAVIVKHVNVQLSAKHVMEKDSANYKVAIKQANINIETAKTELAAMIGTIEKPGWLTSIMLGGSGFGLYFAGAKKKRTGDLNPREHELMMKEEVNKAIALLKTNSTSSAPSVD